MSEQRKRMAKAALDTGRALPGTPVSEGQGTPRDLAACLERARVRLGIQIKEIAYWWQTGHSYVSRILGDQDPLPDHRLAQLPADLQRATCEEWARDLGLITGRKADLARALEALVRLASDDAGHARVLPFRSRLRMAKMTLSLEGK